MKVFAGEFEKIYDPSFEEKTSWYINDHCLIYGKDEWHLFGITHEEPCDPLNEKCCAHSICDTLTGTYRKQMPFPIVADPNRGEAHFWAPHVIEANEVYYMFWCAGSLSDHMTYQIKVSTSLDLYHWEHNSSSNPIVIDGYDARDPMVVKIGGKWILYYTATSSPNYGNHVVKCVESEDLINWEIRERFLPILVLVMSEVPANHRLLCMSRKSIICLFANETVAMTRPRFTRAKILSILCWIVVLAIFQHTQQRW